MEYLLRIGVHTLRVMNGSVVKFPGTIGSFSWSGTGLLVDSLQTVPVSVNFELLKVKREEKRIASVYKRRKGYSRTRNFKPTSSVFRVALNGV